MRERLARLLSSKRSLVIAGTVVVIVIGGLIATVASRDGGSTDVQSLSEQSASSDAAAKKASEGEPLGETKPDKDAYCVAFERLSQPDTSLENDDDDSSIDLAQLSKTFDRLIKRYRAAERVSPRKLRPNYAQALGYLEQGKRATKSQDVEFLKGFAANLHHLNESMETIEAESKRLCG